ncbi:MAG: hypothetical protein GC137_04465 [Alphaproteobacteria bacterium]|nr:hypothetical protein [Alphaproteobacteria bacterium]
MKIKWVLSKSYDRLMMIEKLLLSLNFSAEESKIYLKLLETGPVAAGALAKKIGMPRASLYGFLDKLVEKGAVTQSLENAVKIFIAEQPEIITRLFRDKIEKLQEHQKAYEKIIPKLKEKSPTNLSKPRFEFFEGKDGVQNVLRDLLLYSGIETQSFWPIKAMVDILGADFFEHHNKVRIQNKVSVRALWPIEHVIDMKTHPYLGSGKDFLREIRIAPENVNFTMGYWIYANKIAYLSSKHESYGFIIESREMVDMQKAQFEAIWSLSKAIKMKNSDVREFVMKDLKN